MKTLSLVVLLFVSTSLFAIPDDSTRLINTIHLGYSAISLDYSPDGNFLAIAGGKHDIDIFQPTLGVKMKTLKGGHNDDVLSVRFSPDSRLLATGGADHRILIWDVASGSLLREMKGHEGYVRDLDFSPDGFYLASASWDGTAKIWETGTARMVLDLDRHPDDVTSVAYGDEGKHLITACADHNLRVWSTKSGVLLRTLEGHSDGVWDVKWSPVSDVVASGGWDNKIHVWNPHKGVQVRKHDGHSSDVWSVAFSPDGATFATSGGDRTVKLWDLATGRRLMTMAEKAHDSDVEEIDFSPDGTVIASCSRDGILKFWSVPHLEERINSAVNLVMKDWVQKSPFEKTSEYDNRMKKAQKQSMRIKSEMEKELARFFEEQINWEKTITVKNYNADQGYFLIDSPVLGELRLMANSGDAKKIVVNMERVRFRDLKMKVVKGQLVVDNLTAYLKGEKQLDTADLNEE